MVNEGIIANRLLHGVAPEMRERFGGIPGDSALARFGRDVLSQPGVRCVIVRTGTNDLGFPGSLAPLAEMENAAHLLSGYRTLAARAHARGISVFIATIPPFEGAKVAANYYTPAKEGVRIETNELLRHSRVFDGLIDFDSVLRDPSHPSRLDPRYDSGDHIHPNDAGYRAVADAIPISMLWPRCAAREKELMRMSDKGHPALMYAATAAAAALFLRQGPALAQSSSGTSAFDDQLRQVEQRRDQALVTGDRSVLDRIIADDYHLVSPVGTIDGKAAEIRDAASGFYLSLTPGPISVRHAGPDAAILRYQVAALVRFPSGPRQGRYWHTDYYERRHGQWQVVWSQSTEIRQPASAAAAQRPKTQ